MHSTQQSILGAKRPASETPQQPEHQSKRYCWDSLSADEYTSDMYMSQSDFSDSDSDSDSDSKCTPIAPAPLKRRQGDYLTDENDFRRYELHVNNPRVIAVPTIFGERSEEKLQELHDNFEEMREFFNLSHMERARIVAQLAAPAAVPPPVPEPEVAPAAVLLPVPEPEVAPAAVPLPVPVPEVAPAAVPLPCLLYTSPSPRDRQKSRMPSSA